MHEEDEEDFILRRRREFIAKQRVLRKKLDEDESLYLELTDRFKLLNQEYRDVRELGDVINELTSIKMSYDAA